MGTAWRKRACANASDRCHARSVRSRPLRARCPALDHLARGGQQVPAIRALHRLGGASPESEPAAGCGGQAAAAWPDLCPCRGAGRAVPLRPQQRKCRSGSALSHEAAGPLRGGRTNCGSGSEKVCLQVTVVQAKRHTRRSNRTLRPSSGRCVGGGNHAHSSIGVDTSGPAAERRLRAVTRRIAEPSCRTRSTRARINRRRHQRSPSCLSRDSKSGLDSDDHKMREKR